MFGRGEGPVREFEGPGHRPDLVPEQDGVVHWLAARLPPDRGGDVTRFSVDGKRT